MNKIKKFLTGLIFAKMRAISNDMDIFISEMAEGLYDKNSLGWAKRDLALKTLRLQFDIFLEIARIINYDSEEVFDNE